MRILWRNGQVHLNDADTFTAFKIVVEGVDAELEQVTPAFEGLARFEGRSHAWVNMVALAAQWGRFRDAAWHTQLQAMVETARRFGWVDEATGEVRAHAEWTGGQTMGA